MQPANNTNPTFNFTALFRKYGWALPGMINPLAGLAVFACLKAHQMSGASVALIGAAIGLPFFLFCL